jgi:hypothetical protein
MNERKIRVLAVDPFILGVLFTLNTTVKIETEIPIDAKLVSVDKDIMNNKLNFVYSSQSFSGIKEGQLVPMLPYDTLTFVDEGLEYKCQCESYSSKWKHCILHLNPDTGEMHSQGDHSVRKWIEERITIGKPPIFFHGRVDTDE